MSETEQSSNLDPVPRIVGRPRSCVGRKIREVIYSLDEGILIDARMIADIAFPDSENPRIVNHVSGILSQMMRVEKSLDPFGTYHPGNRRGRSSRVYRVRHR